MIPPRSFLLRSTLSVALCALASCASIQKVGRGSVAAVKSTTRATASGIGSLAGKAKMPDIAGLLPGRKVDVVEVREEDLKEMPLGHERALAFDREKKRGFWVFGGPVDFHEPDLPEAGTELDGSLLPPRPN